MSRASAFALTLLWIVSMPAFGQGSVRGHGGPPAPPPTVDRDHRRGVRENDPVQWEVRGALVRCRGLMISSVRREGLSRSSMLSPSIPEMKWSEDGGDWFLGKDGIAPMAPCRCCSNPQPGGNEAIALYNNRNKRFLTARVDARSQTVIIGWSASWQPVWNLRRIQQRTRAGLTYSRFAIYSIANRRYLMLCHDEVNASKNNEKLCLYNTDQDRS